MIEAQQKELLVQKSDFKKILKDLQADYEKQIQIRDQEIQALQEKLDALSSVDLMDQKYQDRLALIKKIHDEQLTSLKQQITLREQELQTTLEKFKREQQHHETLIREKLLPRKGQGLKRLLRKSKKLKCKRFLSPRVTTGEKLKVLRSKLLTW